MNVHHPSGRGPSERGPSERGRRALDRIEEAQARSRAHFREAGPERALLIELLEASCLLELAKIEPSTLDPALYAQLAVEALVQLYPIAGCAVIFDGGAGRRISVRAGNITVVARRHVFEVGVDARGELIAGPFASGFDDADGFLERAAALVGRGLNTALDAERLRREAAEATATRIVSDLRHDGVERLAELAQALASFPGVIAADLVVDHPAIGAPVDLRAGDWSDDGTEHAVQTVTIEVAPSGRVAGRLRSIDDGQVDDAALRHVLALLATSLDRHGDMQRLRDEAETEPLSGLGNRRRLERVLVDTLARARNAGEHFAVLVLGIDRLKSVNDTFGHDAGDEVILACADVLRTRVRPHDEVVRLDGDEFVVVAPVPDILDALRLADDLRVAIAAGCREVLPPELDVSANVGIAVFPDSGRDPDALLRAADTALHRAKREGRNGVAVAAPSSDVVDEPARRRFFRRPGP